MSNSRGVGLRILRMCNAILRLRLCKFLDCAENIYIIYIYSCKNKVVILVKYGYYSCVTVLTTTRHLWIDRCRQMQLMWCTPRATPCLQWYGAVQSVVCGQGSTLKLLVVLSTLLLVQLFAAWGHWVAVNMTWVHFRAKHSKEYPPPLWQTCKVLRPWALFHETAVLASLKMFYKHCVLGVSTGMTVTKL